MLIIFIDHKIVTEKEQPIFLSVETKAMYIESINSTD